ncbi:hypothetical protein RGQ13_14365 [Thalassotalea psychrophila]|uniref:SGNH hydrolase-type esterase domain-containing protein n=1 Tax=Thalassotalea psychrophila TaxID=3065647 RepID=A0ABY9TUA8_9GAMM|nr:hypothetical protein RGQ13_14365 [Colwelliaceae bacterium SQ149]
MKKVLVFGDSHVGSLKGVGHQFKSDLVKFDFVGFPLPIAKMLVIDSNGLAIRPITELERCANNTELEKWYKQIHRLIHSIDKSGVIKLINYDYIFVYGGRFLYHNWYNLTFPDTSYSSGFLEEYASQIISPTLHYKWLLQIKKALGNKLKVISIPEPILNELVWNYDGVVAQNTDYLALIPNGAKYSECIYNVTKVLTKKGIDLLPLPVELFVDDKAVAAKYKSTNPIDFIHLNTEGAKLVLDNITKYILN